MKTVKSIKSCKTAQKGCASANASTAFYVLLIFFFFDKQLNYITDFSFESSFFVTKIFAMNI